MPTSKKSSKTASKKSGASKTTGQGGSVATAIQSGAVPPYGEAIRQASARGEVQEMRKVAAATRKWLKDVQSALDKLERSLQKSSK